MGANKDQLHSTISQGIRSVMTGAGHTLFLPVAEGGNVQCAFCAPQIACAHAIPFPPAGGPLEPDKAMEQISPLMMVGSPVAELCLAGPGEALVSPATRIVLRVLGWHYPGVMRSLWTNGLLLADQIDELVRLGLSSVIITINAFTRDTSGRLYERLTYRGRGYRGNDAGVLLSEKQWLGLSLAKDRGMRVVVHSSLISWVNEQDLEQIARGAGMLGADGMALTLPAASGQIERQGSVLGALLKEKRSELGVYLPQIDLFP